MNETNIAWEVHNRMGSVQRTISEHERFRRLRGFTITRLASEIGRSRPYVSRVENGHERPSAAYRRDVARVLDVDEALIFGSDGLSDGK